MKLYSLGVATALFVVASGASSVANAALIDRGGGLIYDQDLNITWLADANNAQTSGYDAHGVMNWSEAMNLGRQSVLWRVYRLAPAHQ